MLEYVFRQHSKYEGSVEEEITKLNIALTKLKHTDGKAVKPKEIEKPAVPQPRSITLL